MSTIDEMLFGYDDCIDGCEDIVVDETAFDSDSSILTFKSTKEISKYIKTNFKDLIDEAHSRKKSL